MTRGILYRSIDDRALAGVCGGLGKYFDIDTVPGWLPATSAVHSMALSDSLDLCP